MNLNLFENLKKDIESNVTIKNFMEEVSSLLKDMTESLAKCKNSSIRNENIGEAKENLPEPENAIEKTLNNRKEGHLYFVTEDRNNEVYLWDFTDKPKHEFKEIFSSKELLNVAKEGAMLKYKNGKYELYSQDGYEMLFDEEEEGKI